MNPTEPLSKDPIRHALHFKLWSQVKIEDPNRYYESCWIFQGDKEPGGHGRICHRDKTYMAHRIAYEDGTGEKIPEGLVVRHRCTDADGKSNPNPACCNPFHLTLGAALDNVLDRVMDGRSASGKRNGSYTKPECVVRGESHPRSTLTDEQVKNILALYRQMEGKYGAARATADHFEVDYSIVIKIVKRQSWTHVVDDGRTIDVDTKKALMSTGHRGESHGSSNMTNEQVLNILALSRQYGSGYGVNQAIADAMGLEAHIVDRVIRKETWGHIEDDGRICPIQVIVRPRIQSDAQRAAVKGENSGKATITEETVRNVLALVRQHGTGRGVPPAIAKALGVTTNQVHQIADRRTWTHVQDDGRTCNTPIEVVKWTRRDNPNQLVTEEQVRDIKALARQHPVYGVSRRIADALDLPLHVVQHILSGKNWSHVPDDGRTCTIELPVRGPNKKHPKPAPEEACLPPEPALTSTP